MRIYVDAPKGLSLAMTRVAMHLAETAPRFGFEIVKNSEDAELVLLHVIGFDDTEEAIKRLGGKPFAMMQYCLRSTQQPDTKTWMMLWDAAAVVWSYYDLIAMLKEDRAPIDTMRNFYHAPLGVDARTFRTWATPKSAAIFTSGYVADAECIHEAAEASHRVGEKMVHLGPKENFPELVERYKHIGFLHRINDSLLSQAYSRCRYVAGLRRGEGFELPVLEGLLSGARPICFDRPHYRQWFNDFAEFIPEGDDQEVTASLEALFRGPYRAVTKEEIAVAAERFDWDKLTSGFWAKLREAYPAPKPLRAELTPVTPVTPVTTKKKRKLLWCGDAGVASGFARATHETLETLRHDWDVQVVGINYLGEPHNYPYRIHPAICREAPGDGFGITKVGQLTKFWKPDIVVLQNDPWNIPGYARRLGQTPTVASMPVDGKNCRGTALNGLTLAVFWTEFGRHQAQSGGYTGNSAVIPLGVNLDIYKPGDKAAIRRRALNPDLEHAFIVGNANRNQPRKRWDLTIQFFADWIHREKVADAYLYLHVAPTGDAGYDIEQMAAYYGISNRLILAEPELGQGIPEESLSRTYSMWDVQISTTQGEGWGLTTMEGMACGVPQIVPDWSALGDWAKGYAELVPCTSTSATPNNINVIGGIADKELFIAALDNLYRHPEKREALRSLGLQCAQQEQYRWANIGATWAQALDEAIALRSNSAVITE